MTHLDRLARPWKSDAEYLAYQRAQAIKTQKMKHAVAGHRVTNLVGLLVRADPRPPKHRSVLCVGCRNLHEVGVLHAAGFGPVIGIDLLSQDKQIRAMDMHALDFPDGLFDVIFACHSLEHAYDLDVVLKELRRVSAPGAVWVIEMPVRYQTTDVDRVDVQSIQGLQERCAPYLGSVLYSEDSLTGGVVRLIGRVTATTKGTP